MRPDPPSAYPGGGLIQHSPQICLGIPIAFSQEEQHEANIPARAHESEILEILSTPN